jgi:phosphate transport system permease protein
MKTSVRVSTKVSTRNAAKSKLHEKMFRLLFVVSAAVSIFAVALICLFLFMNGIPAIGQIGVIEFLFSTQWSPLDIPAFYGIGSMIVASLYVTAGAIIIGVPIGLCTAVFLAKSCPKKLYKRIKPGISLLSGIPSVVYGFFGMAAIVPLFGSSLLTASVLLGIMILPTIIELCESAIRAVPDTYYEGALALGAAHHRSVWLIILPAAKSGILASVVLGIGRAVGETMAVIMVIGNQPRLADSLFDGARTLTGNIVLEMGYADGLHRNALIATGVVLFVFILVINLSFSVLTRREKRSL